jgi:hypothetical protein
MRSSLVWLEEEPSEVHLVVALFRSRPAVVLDKGSSSPPWAWLLRWMELSRLLTSCDGRGVLE